MKVMASIKKKQRKFMRMEAIMHWKLYRKITQEELHYFDYHRHIIFRLINFFKKTMFCIYVSKIYQALHRLIYFEKS